MRGEQFGWLQRLRRAWWRRRRQPVHRDGQPRLPGGRAGDRQPRPATYYAHGSVDAQVAASTWYLDAATTQSLGAGHTLLGKAPPSDYFEIQAKPVSSSTPAYSTAHLLVNNGSRVFTVDASL